MALGSIVLATAPPVAAIGRDGACLRQRRIPDSSNRPRPAPAELLFAWPRHRHGSGASKACGRAPVAALALAAGDLVAPFGDDRLDPAAAQVEADLAGGVALMSR
jgi:hypothetical protein